MFQDASQPWAPAAGEIDAGPTSPPDGELRTAKPSSQSQDSATVRAPYPLPAELPTQIGPKGLRFDFNDGCRVTVPESTQSWRVRLSDLDTENVLFQTSEGFNAGRINSTKRYFIRFGIEVWQGDELVLTHGFDAHGRDVAVLFPIGTLGDTLGWFPYAVKFQKEHGCRLTCAMAEHLIPLFADAYPEIAFVTHEAFKAERYYATYRMGLFFDDKDCTYQPCDFRLVGLHRTAGYILGVDPTEEPPRIALEDESRRSWSPMSASRSRARRSPNIGTTRSAGMRSSAF